ncbi:MAG: hypothetical protein ACXWNK_01930 [Vulcanimicrobiaceae bacterium]
MADVLVAIAIAIAGVFAQDLFPGRDLYHYGWYNAAIAALIVYAVLRLRGIRREQPRYVGALAIALFGAGIIAFAGIASGLLGPDTQTIVAAPGASVRNDEIGGTFVFPLPQNGTIDASGDSEVRLQRGGSTTSIGARGRRYLGGFVLWQTPRAVAYVEAQDARGNHLTITQPTNATFLSPVLIFSQTTTIAGMTVPVDTFTVPAAGRIVKVVLFNPQQAAQLHAASPIIGSPALLFAVSDQKDRILPGGIGVVAAGKQIELGGMRLRAEVGTYPAVVLAAAPYLPVLAIGLFVLAIGVVRLIALARPKS